MRRDMDLVRKILLAVEESPGAVSTRDINEKIEGHSLEEINYHTWLLVDAGLMVALQFLTYHEQGSFRTTFTPAGKQTEMPQDRTIPLQSPRFQINLGQPVTVNGLTWAGHEFLESAKDDGIWAHATGMLKGVAGFTFPILQSILADQIRSKLGLPPGA